MDFLTGFFFALKTPQEEKVKDSVMQKETNLSTVRVFTTLCKAWNDYELSDVDSYFRIPLNVMGLNSVNQLITVDEWLDFLIACHTAGVEYLMAKRAFIKYFNI